MTVANNNFGRNTKGRLQSMPTVGIASEHILDFQFNPTTISESRSVDYNYSEGQGQHLPMAQFGKLGETKISFSLFMFSHNGLGKELKSLRRLTLPKLVTRLTYYEQVQPHKYYLQLGQYGTFTGVVENVDIDVSQYSKKTMTPIRLTASIDFVVISTGLASDVSRLKDMGDL